MLEKQLEQILQANNWESRYRFLMKLGTIDNLPFDEADKIDENLVSGCESKVWLVNKIEHGHPVIKASSDSKIVRGLLVIILHEINLVGLDNFELSTSLNKYHLANHLSESRANGLKQVYQQILHKIQQNS
ncbi:SufE family protein [Catenovulum agarivorans]|uniref:SufE family protein n=1 Tax=Catenovulum agarivorans TaxID=1172192 RepID=UPI0003078C6A|nr:SufE family protein [Catenovulum agarivorans]